MTNQLTKQQINWAKSHDWYVGSYDGKIIVVDRYTLHDKYYETTFFWNKSFAELRDWAGY